MLPDLNPKLYREILGWLSLGLILWVGVSCALIAIVRIALLISNVLPACRC